MAYEDISVDGPMMLRWLLFSLFLALLGFAAGWYLRGGPVAELPRPAATEPRSSTSGAALALEPAPWRTFMSQIAAGAVEDAIRTYGAVADPGREPALARRMREHILNHGRLASGRRELESALALLERYTFYYHRDMEAHYRLADAAERLGRSQIALDALLAALEVALNGGPDPQPARERVAVLVDALAAGRLAIDDRSGAMALYQSVLDRDPLNHRYRFLLAAQLEAAGDLRAARRELEQIPVDGHDAVAMAGLAQRISESRALASRFADGLPLTPFGEHFLVEVALDDGQALRLLLDTGATRTVLKPRVVAAALGAERLSERVRIGTANGVVSASRYRLPGLTLGPFRIPEPELVVLDLDGLGSGVDGLLGLDLLSRFDYRIDPANGKLLLAR